MNCNLHLSAHRYPRDGYAKCRFCGHPWFIHSLGDKGPCSKCDCLYWAGEYLELIKVEYDH